VPEALFSETLLELREKFGAISWETQLIHGSWRQGEQTFHDDLIRLFIDVDDSAENRQFFIEYKQTLKRRFNQFEIWLTTFPLDVI